MIWIWILAFLLITFFLYWAVGIRFIFEKLSMFKDKNYWVGYNKIEFLAWTAKAIIIIPGLIFGIELWYMHFLTLITSSLLIWASTQKSLPTLIVFNTMWIGISSYVILKNIL